MLFDHRASIVCAESGISTRSLNVEHRAHSTHRDHSVQRYVRFDRNSYSIPHTPVRPLTLLANPTTVRIVVGTDEIARHARSYDTNQVIEQEAHVAVWRGHAARQSLDDA